MTATCKCGLSSSPQGYQSCDAKWDKVTFASNFFWSWSFRSLVANGFLSFLPSPNTFTASTVHPHKLHIMKFQRHLLPQIPFNLSQTPFAKLLPNLPLSHEAKVAFGQNYGDNDGGGNTGTIIIDTRARDEALLTTSRSINDYLKQQIAIGKGGEPNRRSYWSCCKSNRNIV